MNIEEFTYEQYLNWLYDNSWYPTNPQDVIEALDLFNKLDLEVCDCCGELVEYEHLFQARYDDVMICQNCHDDGN